MYKFLKIILGIFFIGVGLVFAYFSLFYIFFYTSSEKLDKMKIECYDDDIPIFFKFNIESNLSDTGYIIDEIKIKHEFKNREIEILSVPIKFYKNKEFFEGKFEGKASYYDSYELLLGKGNSILLHKFKKNFEVHTEMFGGDKGYCFRDVEVNNTILDPTSLYIDHNTFKLF